MLRSRRGLIAPLVVLTTIAASLEVVANLLEASAEAAGDQRWSDAVTRLHDAAQRLRRGV